MQPFILLALHLTGDNKTGVPAFAIHQENNTLLLVSAFFKEVLCFLLYSDSVVFNHEPILIRWGFEPHVCLLL